MFRFRYIFILFRNDMSVIIVSCENGEWSWLDFRSYADSIPCPQEPDWRKTIFPEWAIDLERLAAEVATEWWRRAALVLHNLSNPISLVSDGVKLIGEWAYLQTLQELPDGFDADSFVFLQHLGWYDLYMKRVKSSLIPTIFKSLSV